jgi:hypothetical protein
MDSAPASDESPRGAETRSPGSLASDRDINLVDHQIEVYSGPQADGYASRGDFKSGDLVPFVVGGTIVGQIAVDDFIS